MSDSDKIRLDPATLRHVASRMREELRSTQELFRRCSPSDDALTGAFVECITDMADECDELATQEEARPPRLWDWVRACEVSKAWPPRSAGTAFGRHELGFMPNASVSLGIQGDGPGSPLHTERACRLWVGGRERIIATPAELTAALNALAEEVEP